MKCSLHSLCHGDTLLHKNIALVILHCGLSWERSSLSLSPSILPSFHLWVGNVLTDQRNRKGFVFSFHRWVTESKEKGEILLLSHGFTQLLSFGGKHCFISLLWGKTLCPSIGFGFPLSNRDDRQYRPYNSKGTFLMQHQLWLCQCNHFGWLFSILSSFGIKSSDIQLFVLPMRDCSFKESRLCVERQCITIFVVYTILNVLYTIEVLNLLQTCKVSLLSGFLSYAELKHIRFDSTRRQA